MPATNCMAEHSFSALCRIKTYVRSTKVQERLNNLLVLHVHKERTNGLDLTDAANKFVAGSELRLRTFGKSKR